MALRRRTVASALLVLVGLGGPLSPALARPAAAADHRPTSARSLLIISLPATAWIDLRDERPPNLTSILRSSAIANLATRSVRSRTEPGVGYLAFGAGTRSLAGADTAGENLAPGETFAGQRATSVFQTRTGDRMVRGIGAMNWPSLVTQNLDLSYEAEPGALGQALRDHSIGRRVIANADEQDRTGTVFHREAALTLMDTTGRVPGRVTKVLRVDPAAPYGVRLDPDAVMNAFPADFGTRRQVVMVEASDLARADSIRPTVTPEQRRVLHSQALAATDALVGRLLERVDLNRDAVVIVAPYHSGRARTLTVAAIHAPGVDPGTLESATTRRAGFVQIVDLAPTVLDLLGQDRPESMEGRPARFIADDETYRDRVNWLVRLDRAAQFRDETIGKATATLVTTTIVLVVITILGFRWYRRRWFILAMRAASLTFLTWVLATFIAGALPIFRWGTGPYFLIVTAIAIGIAAAATALGRGHPIDPILIVLGAVIALHLGDLVTGARLELNTVFGYSPTVGIRLAGIGNPGSAQVSAAALLFVALLPARVSERRNWIGYLILIVTFVIVGAPMFGQDFGGALTLGPTLAVWWWLRSGRTVRVRTVAMIVGILAASGLIVGLVDLTRPSNQRTHIGRLFERVGDHGIGELFGVVGRKASLMIGTFSNTAWVLLVISVLVWLVLASRRSDVLARILTWIPSLRPGLICFAILVGLGTALNDSGVQVSGIMLTTLLCVLVGLGSHVVEPEPATEPAPELARSPA